MVLDYTALSKELLSSRTTFDPAVCSLPCQRLEARSWHHCVARSETHKICGRTTQTWDHSIPSPWQLQASAAMFCPQRFGHRSSVDYSHVNWSPLMHGVPCFSQFSASFEVA
eukprot:5281462-Amphidinium_carterae.1